jgi:hypothetical protein
LLAAPAFELLQSSTKDAINDAAGAVEDTASKAAKTVSGWFG